MQVRGLCFAVVATFLLTAAACSSSRSGGPPGTASQGSSGTQATTPAPSHSAWLSAKEAVEQAYAALDADWKEKAQLVLVGRYSQYAGEECSPFDYEKDEGFSSDGRLEHWAVIFLAPPEASEVAWVFCVRAGSGAELINEHLMAFSGSPSFAREGWVDSIEMKFRQAPVDLKLCTNDDLADVDKELANYSVLWIAYTSFGHYDVYDALTGQYIKSR